MTDLSRLRSDAFDAAGSALECRRLADEMELRRLRIAARAEPLLSAHVPEVWDSAAADSSRALLHRYVAPGIDQVSRGLAVVVSHLRDAADSFDRTARELLDTAVRLEALDAPAATGPDTGVPTGSADAGVRVR